MKKNTYRGQALAIIMIILVVSAIIGFSIIIRSVRDRKAALQERTSAEAYEVVDVILDNMLLYSLKEWNEKGLILGAQKVEVDGREDITSLLSSLGSPINLQSLSICPLSGTENRYTLSLAETDENTLYTVEPGQSFTFMVNGESIGENCKINIDFDIPPSNTGFMLNYIYKDGSTPTSIKDYDYPDADTYCLGTAEPNTCENFGKPEGLNAKQHNPNTLFVIDAGEKARSNPIDKIQVIAVNNRIIFKFSATDCPVGIFDMISLRSSATCNNTYRAKEVLIPKIRSNFSLFNYVLFNGTGSMLTSQ